MRRTIKTPDGKVHLPLSAAEQLAAARRLLEAGCTVEEVASVANLPIAIVMMEAKRIPKQPA